MIFLHRLVLVSAFMVLSIFSFPIIAQQVTLTKVVNTSTPLTGELVTYELQFGCSSLDADCVGAILTDTLPPEIIFDSADPVIIQSGSGPVPITPTYDAASHSITYDFTVLPEGGLPDGFSATAFFNGTVPAGVTPNGATLRNRAYLPSTNAGSDVDSVDVNPIAAPNYTFNKTVDGPIYHDRDITYSLTLCSGGTLGNLNYHNLVVKDTLPAGADFQSATAGGVWDGNDPGIVTWTLDSMDVADPCQVFQVTVQYPSSDMIENNTGLTTQIPKENKSGVVGDPVGESPYTLTDILNTNLLPPVFTLTGSKSSNDNGILPIGERNYFTLNLNNNSTVEVDNFVAIDSIPPQFDLMYLRFDPVGGSQSVTINAYLNSSGTPVTWLSTTTGDASLDSLDVSTIPGYVPGTDYVSAVEFDFGTVRSGFGRSVYLVVTPAYDAMANDNLGNPVTLDSAYENCVYIRAIRPLDGAMLGPNTSCSEMCVIDSLARLAPAKTQSSTNQNPPAGDVTTGNPYLPGSQVTYTIVLENDGEDDVEIDDTGATAFQVLTNPIGSDLLPAGLTYVDGTWDIITDSTSLTLDTMGVNPVFEKIDNFNGTGQTLLRWQFSGGFDIGDYVEIQFNATIDTTSGTDMTNTFCISAAQNFICDGTICGETDTLDLNNFFGTTADPNILIAGVTERCCASTSFTVADSIPVISGDKNLLSSPPFAPTGTDLAELGLASDTLEFSVALANDQMANVVLPNPIASDLLPEELEFVDGSMVLVSDNTGLGLSVGGGNPQIDIIHDFNGTGRTLIRWDFTGDFPINTEVEFRFKTYIRAGSSGIITNAFNFNGDSPFYNCASGISFPDTLDFDEDADIIEALCTVNAQNAAIQTVASLAATKYVKGALDTTFLRLPDTGVTLPSDSVTWRMNVYNPGNVPLTEIVIVDIFPFIGDMGVQLNTTPRETGWRPFLVDTIAKPPSRPNMTIYYSQEENPCRPEISPVDGSGCVDDWTTSYPADLSTVQAIKFVLADTLQPTESFDLDIYMMSPDSGGIVNPIAWNSLARDAKELLAQEPNKVGVELKYFDLALTKMLASSQSSTIETQDTIDFTIEITNQGCFSVDSITIVDYIPYPQLTLFDSDWTQTTDSTATILLPGTLAPNATTSVDITMIVASNVASDTIVNFAEIFSATDSLDNIIPDFDSTPDSLRTNDDNSIDNNITGGLADEDDHDGEQIIIQDCDIPSFMVTTECLDNSSPLNPLDDEFNFTITLMGTSVGKTYTLSNVHGFERTMLDYDMPYSTSGDTTFMAVMGGFNLTLTDEENEMCFYTDTLVPPATCSIIDLAVEKTIDTTCAVSGDTVNFTILLTKEMTWDVKIDTVQVLDTLPTGMTYLSHTATQGTYNSTTGIWDLGTVYEGTDSLYLNISARIDDFHDGGTMTNYAEVYYASQGDIDSTPDNNTDGEDDIGYACLNVPTYICPELNDSLVLNAPVGSTNVMWYRDIGVGPTLVGSGLSYVVRDSGEYTFTADVILCPGGECCPTYVREGCFDLALKKTLATGQLDTINPGESATFTVTVYNQGIFDAYDIDVIDYYPSSYMHLNDGNWTDQNDTAAVRTITGPLVPGDSIELNITLDLDLNYMDSLQINWSEIQDATDRPGGTTKPDKDSSPDFLQNNDIVGGDNILDNTMLDEDDHDFDSLFVRQIFDLALIKVLDPAETVPARRGDTLSYIFYVQNQGTLNAYDIEVSDYIPSGFLLVDPDWTQTADTARTVIDSIPARTFVLDTIDLRIDPNYNGIYNVVNYAEISFATEHDGSGILTPDEDSNPDSDNTNDTGGIVNSADDNNLNGGGPSVGEDEDDHDPEDVNVLIFDLALKKELAAAQNFIVEPGDTVSFTIEVFNQSNVTAYDILLTDYLPDSTTLIGSTWAAGGGNTATYTIPSLNAGDSTTVDISMSIDFYYVDTVIVNNSEISFATYIDNSGINTPDEDSTPNAILGDDIGGNVNVVGEDDVVTDDGTIDEDDHDPEDIRVERFDLALRKTLATGQSSIAEWRDTVQFTITVFNQGNIPAYDIDVVDYIPEHMSLADAAWTSVNDSTATRTIAGPLAAGDTMDLNIGLRVDTTFIGTQMVNYAEIQDGSRSSGGPSSSDFDSTPDGTRTGDLGGVVSSADDNNVSGDAIHFGQDEDDHDPALIEIQLPFDLALRKGFATGQDSIMTPGDTVLFEITVYNQDELKAYDIQLVDYIPANLTLVDSDWSQVVDTAYYTIDSLAAFDSVKIGIDLLVDQSFFGGFITNYSEVSFATAIDGSTWNTQDIDSNADSDTTNDTGGIVNTSDDNNVNGDARNLGQDEDDHDPEDIFVERFDLALKKELATGQSSFIFPGDTATFTITVYSQGNVDAYDIVLADYIPDTMMLVDPNWTQVGDTAYFTIDTLVSADSFMVDIDLAVDTSISENYLITNYAEISFATRTQGSGMNTEDEDSFADIITTNDTGGTPGNPAEDDVVTDDGTIDEDDHDPAQITATPCEITSITLVQQICDNNSTGSNVSDDYYRLVLTATVVNPGSSGRFEVVQNTTVLNPGGTLYGQNVEVGINVEFPSDGTTVHTLTIRDIDRNECTDTIDVGPFSNCLTCPPQHCLPATIQIQKKTLENKD